MTNPLLTDQLLPRFDALRPEHVGPANRGLLAAAARAAATRDPVQQRVIEHMLRDFRLAGVALDPARKARFKQLMLELATLQSKFEENVLDATNAWTRHVTDYTELAGLNEAIVE